MRCHGVGGGGGGVYAFHGRPYAAKHDRMQISVVGLYSVQLV